MALYRGQPVYYSIVFWKQLLQLFVCFEINSSRAGMSTLSYENPPMGVLGQSCALAYCIPRLLSREDLVWLHVVAVELV